MEIEMAALNGVQLYLLMGLCAGDDQNLVVITLKDGSVVYKYPQEGMAAFMDWYLESQVESTRLGEETHLRKSAEFRLPATATLNELLSGVERANCSFLTSSI